MPRRKRKRLRSAARLLIEQAEALGESLEDPMLLFSVLYASLTANYVAFNGDVMRELAAHFLALAEKQGSAAPLMVGHRLMANALASTGDLVKARVHIDQALALYDPVEHGPLAARFGADVGVSTLSFRSLYLWFLGYPEAALIDAGRAVTDARKTLQAITLLFALYYSSLVHAFCGNYTTASREIEELIALAHEKGALFWKAYGIVAQGLVFALTGKAMDAIQALTNGLSARRLAGATNWIPLFSSCLGRTYVEIGQFNDARNCITEALTAIRTTNERWCEAEVNRVAGEMALLLPEADAVQAAAYFERALAVAREQQAKSWELRAAMSMARLWRDQGKRQQAHDLLAPVYGWFTEGFDTLDLKEAKTLLSELSS
jgi:predicted ATPase